jgi:hypothetical protein
MNPTSDVQASGNENSSPTLGQIGHIEPAAMQTPSLTPGGRDVDPMQQLVGVERLIELVWAPDARPCAKWVRQQTKLGAIPCVERGNRVWFVPKHVIEALGQRITDATVKSSRRRGRPPGSKNKLKSVLQGSNSVQPGTATP